jgi:hypothetical protein
MPLIRRLHSHLQAHKTAEQVRKIQGARDLKSIIDIMLMVK